MHVIVLFHLWVGVHDDDPLVGGLEHGLELLIVVDGLVHFGVSVFQLEVAFRLDLLHGVFQVLDDAVQGVVVVRVNHYMFLFVYVFICVINRFYG